MTEREASTPTDGATGSASEPSTDADGAETRRSEQRRVCRDTGREQGLVGAYDIWLCRQSFRELAREMGFRKYD